MYAKRMMIAMIMGMGCMSQVTMAAESAVIQSGKAMAQMVDAGVKVSAGVVAVPLLATGSVGVVASKAGIESINYANGFEEALPIGEEVVVTGPSPAEAMGMQ